MPDPATKLACAACAAPLDPDDGPRVGGALRCRFCGAFTRVAPVAVPPAFAAAPAPAAARAVAERPRSVTVEETAFGVRVVRRWFSPVFFFLLFFCVVWNGILLAFYGMSRGSGMPWFVLLFPVVHVAVGLGLAYFTLCGFVNRTVVEVERGHTLTVRHGPLPWPGATSLDVGEIAQLFVGASLRRGRGGTEAPAFSLAAMTRDGRRVTLLKVAGLSVEEALYLEQELERRLRIRDEPVVGEVARDGG